MSTSPSSIAPTLPQIGSTVCIQDIPYKVIKDLREDSEGKFDWYLLCENNDPDDKRSFRNEEDSSESILPRQLAIFWRLDLNGEPLSEDIELRRELRRRMRGIRNVPRHFEVNVKLFTETVELERGPSDGIEVREYLNGITLSNWMKKYAKHKGQGETFRWIEDSDTWFKIAEFLTEALRSLHDERIVHGDLCPRNIVFCRQRPSPEADRPSLDEADFFSKFFEENYLDVVVLEAHAAPLSAYHLQQPPTDSNNNPISAGTYRRKYDSPLLRYVQYQNTLELSQRTTAHWFSPTDIFSLGMILFELAFGSAAVLGPFIEEDFVTIPDSTVDPQGEEPQPKHSGPVWYRIRGYEARRGNRQLKDALLEAGQLAIEARNAPLGGSSFIGVEFAGDLIRRTEVILACLRSQTDRTVADLQVLETVRRQFYSGVTNWLPSSSSDTKEFNVVTAGQKLVQVKNSLDSFYDLPGLPAIVRSLAKNRGTRFINQLKKLASPQHPAYFLQVRERSAMVDAMVSIVNHLENPERCTALLTPTFFHRENLGFYGRLTAALQLAALRDVAIDWIILLNKEQLTSKPVQEILRRQRAAYKWLCKFTGKDSCNYGVYYAVATSHEYERVLRNQHTSIFLYLKPESMEPDGTMALQRLLIAPDYHGEEGAVAALRLWPEIKLPAKDNEHRRERAAAQSERREELVEAFNSFQKRKISVRSFAL